MLSTLREVAPSLLPDTPTAGAVLAATVVGATTYLLYRLSNSKALKPNANVPGPSEWPFFGCFFECYPYVKTNDTDLYIESLLKTHGNIVRFNLPGLKMIIIRDAEAAKMVLSQTKVGGDFYRWSPEPTPFIFPHMLFAMDTTTTWKRHREILVPAFSPSNLRFGMEASLEAASDLCDALRTRCEMDGGKTELDIYAAMAAFTVDVIGKLAFSYDFKTAASIGKDEMNKDVELLSLIFMIIAKRFLIPPMFWRSSGISEQSPTLAQATSYLKGIVTEVIREKRAAKEKGVTSGRRDLLDQMMDKDFDDTELFEEVVGFFLAGHETTSNTLMYTVLELCRNPDVHAKLQREISTILPHKESPLTLDNLKDFKYLEQVIKEAQRLHTVVGVVGRNAAKDMKIMGYDIEAGTNINIPIKHIHLDERYWPEPQKFDPERFAEGRAAPVPGSYLPFSDGPHNCIGSKLAFIEAKVVLIQLLRQFDVELIPGQTFKYKNGVTTTLENGVRVKLGLKNKGCDDNFGVQSVVEE